MSVNVLGIIPARGGSKRIPRKNIARLLGKPLIAYAIEAAQSSKTLDACIVSTDDPEIAAVAKSFGGDAPFLRPKNYAHDHSPDTSYARHTLQWVLKHRGWRPEIIVFLPPDCPGRVARDIDRAVALLIKGKFDSVRTLVRPIPYVPYKAMWTAAKAGKHRVEPLFPQYVGKPSQRVPEYYLSIGAAYVTRAKYVMDGRMWGPRVGGLVIEEERGVEIDEPEDMQRAEKMLVEMRHKRARA